MSARKPESTSRPTQRSASWAFGGLVARLLVGGLFIYAAWNKIADPAKFVEEVQAYEMAPLGLTHSIAYILPWLEMIAAVMLIVCLWRSEARLLILGMLVAFTIGKISVEIRGLDISCGCWGNDWMEGIFSGLRGILLNVALLLLLGVDLIAQRRTRKPRRDKRVSSDASPPPQPAT